MGATGGENEERAKSGILSIEKEIGPLLRLIDSLPLGGSSRNQTSGIEAC